MYHIIWEYKVKPDCIFSFEALYGAQGKWVKLFSKSKHYGSTDLLKRTDQPSTYLTIDHWETEQHYQAFLRDKKIAYTKVDDLGDAYTESEIKIGGYDDIEFGSKP
ncbi:MAG: antibiotic biosynthesis monooxygenase family protein [Cyclobacteriaceae bacterium]